MNRTNTKAQEGALDSHLSSMEVLRRHAHGDQNRCFLRDASQEYNPLGIRSTARQPADPRRLAQQHRYTATASR